MCRDISAELNELRRHGMSQAWDTYFSPSWTAFQADRGRHFTQLVEQLIRNEKVGCSIHLSGTKLVKESPLFKT